MVKLDCAARPSTAMKTGCGYLREASCITSEYCAFYVPMRDDPILQGMLKAGEIQGYNALRKKILDAQKRIKK